VLRNPADDFTKGVFDPAVRGKTDRFMLRFRRP
jgi:predicted methyltransferase